jgi:uncharacterized protein
MTDDGLNRSDRAALLDALSRFPRVERVILFGSRAMGTHAPSSDIDLALVGAGLTLRDELEIGARIEDLGLVARVDLVRYDTIKNPDLLDHIARHGKPLHG